MDDRDGSLANGVISFGPFRCLWPKGLLMRRDEPLPIGGRELDILMAPVELQVGG